MTSPKKALTRYTLAPPRPDRPAASLGHFLTAAYNRAKTVLALRSKYGVPQKTLTDAARYYDTSYLEAAGIK